MTFSSLPSFAKTQQIIVPVDRWYFVSIAINPSTVIIPCTRSAYKNCFRQNITTKPGLVHVGASFVFVPLIMCCKPIIVDDVFTYLPSHSFISCSLYAQRNKTLYFLKQWYRLRGNIFTYQTYTVKLVRWMVLRNVFHLRFSYDFCNLNFGLRSIIGFVITTSVKC